MAGATLVAAGVFDVDKRGGLAGPKSDWRKSAKHHLIVEEV